MSEKVILEDETFVSLIQEVLSKAIDVSKNRGKLIAGNADAQHITREFVRKFLSFYPSLCPVFYKMKVNNFTLLFI